MNTYTSPSEQSSAIINHLKAILLLVLSHKPRATIAVSGGKSPIVLFDMLSNTELPWEHINITLVDERVIAVTNEDSNENLVRTYLLKNKASKATFVGLMNDNFEQIIPQAKAMVPNIDIAILGMGEDGHTASIFPDCKELPTALDPKNSNRYMITTPNAAPYQRITLTMQALIDTPQLILAINGDTKRKIVGEIPASTNEHKLPRCTHNDNFEIPIYLNTQVSLSASPISYLLQHRHDTFVCWRP